MKPIDIVVIALVVAVLIFAVYLNRRRKRTSSCCGNCAECGKRQKGCDNKKRERG